jgi:enediyne biosynthesis protein E4
VSQPYNRGCQVPAPGRPDAELGEFWVDNPWRIPLEHNLSAYERNRTFWNCAGGDFLDISGLTGTDSDGDGRAAVAADFNNDGRVDLVVRQAGGGSLRLFENQFDQRHWLQVTLRGVQSNRLGVGARLVARVGERRIVRDLHLVNSFLSRAPAVVYFGLGEAERVDGLRIEWPSGTVQELAGLPADRHVVIEEGSQRVETVQPGQTISP